jgi:hypothetical protein
MRRKEWNRRTGNPKWQSILYDVQSKPRANHQVEEELNYSNMAFKAFEAVPPNGSEKGG